MPKLKKRWYAPGLISLLGLFFFLPYANKKMEPEKIYTLPIFVPDTKTDKDDSYYVVSESEIEHRMRHKKKFKIILDNNEETNQEKLKIIRRKALELKYTNDTTVAIIAGLTDSTSYSVLVELLDMCYEYNYRIFTLVKGSFVLWHQPPSPPSPANEFPCFLCNDVISINPPKKEPGWVEKILTHKKQLSLFSGWFLLATIATYMQWRRKQIPRI